jgi:hypothetical protein
LRLRLGRIERRQHEFLVKGGHRPEHQDSDDRRDDEVAALYGDDLTHEDRGEILGEPVLVDCSMAPRARARG